VSILEVFRGFASAVKQSSSALLSQAQTQVPYLIVWAVLLFSVSDSARASEEDSLDADLLVNLPQIEAPVRGSLSGEASQFQFPTESLQRGSFALNIPIQLPEERGRLIHPFLPSYSISTGLSEWGLGFSNQLKIQRFRTVGHINFEDDGFTSPWGELRKGSDDYYYPLGLKSNVRLKRDSVTETWTAILANGDRLIFGGTSGQTRTLKGVYSWHLVQATGIKGEWAQYQYRARNSTSDIPLLETVRYGGRGESYQYEISIQYQPLAKPFLDYRVGERTYLSDRVSTISVRSKKGLGFSERFQFLLNYRDQTDGPGFFLKSIQKVYPNGSSEPKFQFHYGEVVKKFSSTQWREVPEVNQILSTVPNAFQPGWMSITPSGLNDGRTELEVAKSLRVIRMIDGKIGLADGVRTSNAHYTCQQDLDDSRPRPRILSQIRGPLSPVDVLGFEVRELSKRESQQTSPYETVLRVCDRSGQEQQRLVLPSRWRPGPITRISDITRDGKPELIRFLKAGSSGPAGSAILLEVLVNESTEKTVAFSSEPKKIYLGGGYPSSQPAFLVEDFNGDSISDLAAVWTSGLSVWFGRGNLDFEFQSDWISFQTDGAPTLGLHQKRLSFTDLNGDGMSDALVQGKSGTSVFMNDGRTFRYARIPALVDNAWASFSKPFLFDLDGSGNVQIVAYDSNSEAAKVLELSEPGTNLLQSINDGKGNKITFGYGRAKATAGIGTRMPVIGRIETRIIGEGVQWSTYRFDQPVNHLSGRKFLGFETLNSNSRKLRSQYSFDVPQEGTPVLRESSETDEDHRSLTRFTSNQYEPHQTSGIPWLRLRSQEQGFRSSSIKYIERTDYLSYANEVCPARTQVVSAAGKLVRTVSYDRPSLLSESMNCLPSSVIHQGNHPHSQFDFLHETRVSRASNGLPVEVWKKAGNLTRHLQLVTYDADWEIASVSVPGKGMTRVGRDASTGLLQWIQQPDGGVKRAERDPITDRILQLSEERGGKKVYSRSFAFDAFERLAKFWTASALVDGVGDSGSITEFHYEFASETRPGMVREVHQMAAGNDSMVSEWTDLVSGTGTDLVRLGKQGGNGVLNRARFIDREQGEDTALNSKVVDYSKLVETRELGQIYSGLTAIEQKLSSGLGLAKLRNQLHESNQIGKTESSMEVSDRGLKTSSLENGSYLSVSIDSGVGKKGSDRIVYQRLPNGSTYHYTYDVLGRLVEVRLPAGQVHRTLFDSFGDVREIFRSQVARIQYDYDLSTGLLLKKEFLDLDHQVIQSENHEYDELGRAIRLRFTDEARKRSREFVLEYGGSDMPGQLGRLIRVRSHAYDRSMTYRLDGKLAEERLLLRGFGTLKVLKHYRSDGEWIGERYELLGLEGGLIRATEFLNRYDPTGRQVGVDVNGKPAVRLDYNEFSQLSSAYLGDSVIRFDYAPTTQKLDEILTNETGISWSLDNRGLVSEERFNSKNGASSRKYLYDSNGFLTHSSGGNAEHSYAYDMSGSLTAMREGESRIELAPTVNESRIKTLKTAESRYTYDSLGRTSSRAGSVGAWNLSYGPQGRVESYKTSTGDQIEYDYDEAGVRFSKARNGQIEEFYRADLLVTPQLLLLPIKVNSQVIGYIDNNQVQLLGADARNTVISNQNGNLAMVEAYGFRKGRTNDVARQSLIDYAAVGYDSDLGAYRMDHRDYDPRIKRFLTPDLHFLENPKACVDQPVECQLYNYARNNPIRFTDKKGKFADPFSAQDPGVQAAYQQFQGEMKAAWQAIENFSSTYVETVGMVIGAAVAGPAAVEIVSDTAAAASFAWESPRVAAAVFSGNSEVQQFVSDVLIAADCASSGVPAPPSIHTEFRTLLLEEAAEVVGGMLNGLFGSQDRPSAGAAPAASIPVPADGLTHVGTPDPKSN